jgi:hypothetical protein
MPIEWQAISPVIVAIVTVFLMWLDWLLTMLQEREMVGHYAAHYQSYPVNTVEGNPLLQRSVKRARVIEPRHIGVALVLGVAVGFVSTVLEGPPRELFIGYAWGLFLIVGTTHLGNLIGYRASRQGLHGKLYLHQRTGLLVQMGRYAAMSAFVALLALASGSIFVAGVALAGATSSLRQVLWLRRVPPISPGDPSPRDLAASSSPPAS